MKNRIKYRNKCILHIQRVVRGYLARKQHQPRYRGIAQIKSLKEQLRKSTEIVGQLKANKDVILRQANDVEHLIAGYVKNIQNDARISSKTIDAMYADIITKIDQYNNMLKAELQVNVNNHSTHFLLPTSNVMFTMKQKQRQAEEQEHLRKIQEALAAERKQKELEDLKLREEEEIRRR